MNREFLKEAIADAKAVKETAIANAKAALEESFTPHLKTMLSAKLEEMELDSMREEDDDTMREEDDTMREEDKVDEAKDSDKMAKAAAILKEENPNLVVDGEIQGDFALDAEKMQRIFPFSPLAEESANTLIFPNLSSGNMAYKLIQEIAEVDSIGPVLVGMKKPVHILQLGCTVREIINMVTLSVVDAQIKR